MGTVADILELKGRQVHTIDREATALDAVRKMVETNVGSLVVTAGEEISGIFTERDYLRRVVLGGRSPETRLLEVASERLIVVDSSRPIEECMAIMTQERIRHLPVIEGRKLAGMISIGDVVKYVSTERAIELRYLTDYISGKYPG